MSIKLVVAAMLFAETGGLDAVTVPVVVVVVVVVVASDALESSLLDLAVFAQEPLRNPIAELNQGAQLVGLLEGVAANVVVRPLQGFREPRGEHSVWPQGQAQAGQGGTVPVKRKEDDETKKKHVSLLQNYSLVGVTKAATGATLYFV